MRFLIVNGDDLGAGRGINRGILEAHRHGILTSASLMVDGLGAEEAAALAREAPGLSVGLHAAFTAEDGEPLQDFADGRACRAELERQLGRFEALVGRPPTHLDSHHHVHHNEEGLLPLFQELAAREGLPLRQHSAARYVWDFYGQQEWGETLWERIGVPRLVEILTGLEDGISELGCHPGYEDPQLATVYSAEREVELAALCDPAVLAAVEEGEIRLIGFAGLAEAQDLVMATSQYM